MLLPFGGATVAYTFDDANQLIRGGLARCNKNDLYCKVTGRKLATKRLIELSKVASTNNKDSTESTDTAEVAAVDSPPRGKLDEKDREYLVNYLCASV